MKTSKTPLSLLAIAFLAVGLLCQSARALPLPPGGTNVPPNTATNPFNTPPASQPVAPLTSAYFSAGNLSGSVTSWVFRNDPQNLLGGLTFVYLVTNSPGIDAVERFTVGGFTGFTVDTIQSNGAGGPGAGTFPSDMSTRTLNGDVVGFNFTAGNAIPAGSSSFYLIIRTNAQSFTTIDGGVIDNAGASMRVYTAAVPEGGSALALLGLSLLAVEGLRRKFAIG